MKVAKFAPRKEIYRMSKKILTTLLLILAATALRAENIVIGEPVPKIHVRQWLMDFRPAPADYTCIVFYHSESPTCRRALPAIKRVIDHFDGRMNAVIVTKEDYDAAGVTLTEHLDDLIGVAFDEDCRTFRYFLVNYIPYCVVCDHKRRAVWCGNAANLDEKTLERLINASKVKYKSKNKNKKK